MTHALVNRTSNHFHCYTTGSQQRCLDVLMRVMGPRCTVKTALASGWRIVRVP